MSDHIYVGGANGRIKRYRKPGLSFVDESPDFDGTIKQIVVDRNFVFAGGSAPSPADAERVKKYDLEDMSFVVQTVGYGGTIHAVREDAGVAVDIGRGSIAFDNNGAEYPNDTAIFEPFHEEQRSLRMSEGTENLLSENQSSNNNSTNGWDSHDASMSPTDQEFWHGDYSMEFLTNGNDTGEGGSVSILTPSAGHYTGSIWLKGSGDLEVFLIVWYDNYAQEEETARIPIALTGEWQRVITPTFDASGITNIDEISLRFITATSPQQITFYADGCQIEEKRFASPWHIGGQAVRADEECEFYLIDPLPQEFGLGVIFQTLWDSDSGVLGFRRVVSAYEDADNAIEIVFDESGTHFFSEVRINGSSEFRGLSAVPFEREDRIAVYLERRPTEFRFWLRVEGDFIHNSGYLADSRTLPDMFNMKLGSAWWGGDILTGLFTDVELHVGDDIDPESFLNRLPGAD